MKDETPRHSVSRRLSPLKEEEIRPAADEAPRQPAKLKPRPPPVSTSRDSSPAESKTFLTALVPAGRRQNEALRPPSPLESLEPSSDYVDTGGALEPPEPANYMGMEAMQQFWGIFHRQETVHNNKAVPPTVSSVVARPKSARTNYLAAVRNLRLCPEPLGIVRRRVVDKTASYASGSTTQEVNLSSYRMGNACAAAFGEGFSLLPGVESLNLSHNRIGDIVAARLITAAAAGTQGTAGLQQLNLSHNALATASSRALTELMRRSRTLTSLNLSHTGLRDREVQQLCESLTINQTVNRFGAPGMLAVARFLEEHSRIEERIWPGINYGASSGPSSASGTGNTINNSSGGVLRPRAVVTALADSLANNKVLAHLDLSSNRLDLEDCTLLAKQLENNQTLIGLHMSGNCAVMDSRGFLIPKAQAHDEEGGGSRRLRDQHKLYLAAVFEDLHSDAGSGVFPPHLMSIVDASCWYCGLWTEHRFTWTPTAGQGPFAGTTDRFEITLSMEVRLHLSIDDWRGVAMERRENDGDGVPSVPCVSFLLVLPAISSRLPTQMLARTAQPMRVITTSTRVLVVLYNVNSEEAETAAAIQGGVFATLERLNVLRLTQRGGRDPCNTLVPRSSGKNNGRRGKWDINKSVFARRKRESECRSFVDTDGFIPKPVLQTGNSYTEFLSEAKILDESSEYCSLPDLENVFVAANLELTQEAKEKDNPDRSLTRFEFLECIIRIATNKYFRTNVCDTPAKAVDKLLQENIQPVASEDANEFRSRFLYTEEVSDAFTEHITLLQELYDANMGKYCKPGEKKGMHLVEFLVLL
ncbi:Leucine-rich repeat domain, L domain-like [Phytophthora cactorum]|nr:Leucine-rich repeat domain, L domain-like [Phytophthora cactorum]